MHAFRYCTVAIFLSSIIICDCGLFKGFTFDRPIEVDKFDSTKTCNKVTYGFDEPKNKDPNAQDEDEKLKTEWSNRLQGKTGWVSKLNEYGGEAFGELGSWVAAMVLVAKGVTDIVAIVSPGIGVFSWVAGAIVTYQKHKEQQEFVRNLQSALADISNDMNKRFEKMKDYVDASTIEFEKSVLGGEFNQMYEYLSDCVKTNEHSTRSRCLVDRCSYVRAGFKKFAIYYDELSQEYKPDPIFDWKKLTTLETTKFIQERNKWKKDFKTVYNRLTGLQIKRIQANMPMFTSYVQSLLIPCEFVRLFYGAIQVAQIKDANKPDPVDELVMEQFQAMQDSDDEWKLKPMIYNYINNANRVIMAGYAEYEEWKIDDNLNPKRLIAYGGKKEKKDGPISVQCRMKMNPMNLDMCDFEEVVVYSKEDKEKYNGNIDAILKGYCLKFSAGKKELYETYAKVAELNLFEKDTNKWYQVANRFNDILESLKNTVKNTKVKN